MQLAQNNLISIEAAVSIVRSVVTVVEHHTITGHGHGMDPGRADENTGRSWCRSVISELACSYRPRSQRSSLIPGTRGGTPLSSGRAGELADAFRKIEIGNYIKPKSRILMLDSCVSFLAFVRSAHVYESALVFDGGANEVLGQVNKTDILLYIIILHRSAGGADAYQPWNITLADWTAVKQLGEINRIGSNSSFLDISHVMAGRPMESIYVWSDTKRYYISDLSHLYVLDVLVQNIKASAIDDTLTLRDLGVGTFDNIVSLDTETSYIQAVETLAKNDVYLAPVIEAGKLYGVFSRKTAANYLLKSLDGRYLLDFEAKLDQVVDRHGCPDGSDAESIGADPSVHVLYGDAVTITQAISALARNYARRLIIADPNTREVCGIVTLTDIVTALTASS